MPQAAGRPHCGHGQLAGPQGARRAGEDRSYRCQLAVSAALFSRPQPHRKMLGQDQAAAANSESSHRRGSGSGYHPSGGFYHFGERSGLAAPLRISAH